MGIKTELKALREQCASLQKRAADARSSFRPDHERSLLLRSESQSASGHCAVLLRRAELIRELLHSLLRTDAAPLRLERPEPGGPPPL